MKKNILLIIIGIFLAAGTYTIAAPAAAPVKPAAEQAAASVIYTEVTPIDVVKNPVKYLNKNIKFNAEFIAFSSLGLDYKPAFRDGTKYISILIRRNDNNEYVIPLSEMKIFISRELAEKNIDIGMGDKIYIEGKVFSNALGDPWMDVNTLKITEHKTKDTEK